jgi:short subunit dehydrogenase-like uncharacterized protein
MRWMIYGATGYTGPLVAQVALEHGHQPLLAGRNAAKLQPLADALGLEYVAFSLDDPAAIGKAIAEMDVVYHAAGPFIHTAEPMIRACLATGTHYMDLTGEVPVFQQTFQYDEAARKNGVALISGMGFDVVATGCMAQYVAEQVPAAAELEIGVVGFSGSSAGTAKSAIEALPDGIYIRRDGRLVDVPLGAITHRIPTPDGDYQAMAVPWGDIETAYQSLGIPNITTYLALPRLTMTLVRAGSPLLKMLFRVEAVRNLALNLVDKMVDGPSETVRMTTKSYIWARASNPAGDEKEAWLQTIEPYRFTAEAGVRAVEQLLTLQPVGALAPAQAFGTDFVLSLPDTQRFDSLS